MFLKVAFFVFLYDFLNLSFGSEGLKGGFGKGIFFKLCKMDQQFSVEEILNFSNSKVISFKQFFRTIIILFFLIFKL